MLYHSTITIQPISVWPIQWYAARCVSASLAHRRSSTFPQSENHDAPIRFNYDAAQPPFGRSEIVIIDRAGGFRRALRPAVQLFGDLASLRSGFNFACRRASLE